ncbi:DUF4307 domain-containing protein [Nocardioides seonyuensis]|uniref:DUF4307 domain-containing protein n=1 Tax=Nocardioides seonyuensis TaxID=2518371 RepID=UPI0014209EED|nr:DUF4307 domain-containing protein [Nocardioides seonyuensis]
MTTDLAQRYGAPSPWRRRTGLGLAVVVAVVGLGWLAWAAWFHSTPSVESELVGFNVESDHATSATVHVDLSDDLADSEDATCRLRAYAEDHTMVGELAFTPVDGVNEVVVRTERGATTVEGVGCTAPGQDRPR